jgi:hypothetical protein
VHQAQIILCSAERACRRWQWRGGSGVSRPAFWRWQARYAEQGVDGLLRDKTRKRGRAPLSAKVVAKILELTCSEPPREATHWTGRAMAKAVGVSLRAVQRLWQAHRLSRAAFAPSSAPTIPISRPKSKTSSGSTWTRLSTPCVNLHRKPLPRAA